MYFFISFKINYLVKNSEGHSFKKLITFYDKRKKNISMSISERRKFIRALKRDIFIRKKELRSLRFQLFLKNDKAFYQHKIEFCLEEIEELQSRVFIHQEILQKASFIKG